MGLTPKFNSGKIQGMFQKFTEQVYSKEMQALIYTGENFVNEARQNGSYTDRTGNLRSSVGYVIGLDGKIVQANFSGTSKGKKEGRNLAKNLLSEYSKGYILIGVAGMEYALAVESKGYDVITGSSPKAESILKDVMK